MKGKDWQKCSECGKDMQRCRPAYFQPDGTTLYVCRRCWADLNYDAYLYEHREVKDA